MTEAVAAESLPTSPEDDFRAVSGLPAPSVREKDCGYIGVICHLNDRCRVINCKDDLQWVVQRLDGAYWRGVSFHRDRAVLIVRSGATGAALDVLRSLPEQHR